MMTEAQGLELELDSGDMVRKILVVDGGHDKKQCILTEGGERVKLVSERDSGVLVDRAISGIP